MTDSSRPSVLFVCVHNAGRSQMGAAFTQHLSAGAVEVRSAGSAPADAINPAVREAMAEVGIDIRSHRSKGLDSVRDLSFDEVVTVCDHARESCPVFFGGGVKRHQGFPDPSAALGTDTEVLAIFRQVRDEIRQWIEETY